MSPTSYQTAPSRDIKLLLACYPLSSLPDLPLTKPSMVRLLFGRVSRDIKLLLTFNSLSSPKTYLIPLGTIYPSAEYPATTCILLPPKYKKSRGVNMSIYTILSLF